MIPTRRPPSFPRPTPETAATSGGTWQGRSRGPNAAVPRLLTAAGRTRKSPCRRYLDALFAPLVMTSYNFLPIHFYLSILACLNIVYFGSDAAAELVIKVRFAAVQVG